MEKTEARGFTLLELMAVIAILGLVSALVYPELFGFFSNDLGRVSLRLAATMRFLHEEAVAKRQWYRLNYDTRTGRYWAEVADDAGRYLPVASSTLPASQLPPGVSFASLAVAGRQGITFTTFSPSGVVDRTSIVLEDEMGHQHSLTIMPLTGQVKIVGKE